MRGGVEDGVANGWGYGHDGGFAGAGGGDVFAIEEDGFDFGEVAEARDTVTGEARICDATVFEFDGFEERAAEALDVCTDDLIAQAVGIDDGAAFEGGDQTHDADAAGIGVDRDLRAGSDVTSLLVSPGDAEAAVCY